MTQLVPESWQQTLGHLRDNIHGAIDRWWHRPTPAVGRAQVEVMYRAGTFRVPSLPFRETPGFNVGKTDNELIVTTDVPELKPDDYTVEIVKRGSVVLIRYPFTDLTGAKVRLALVLTPDHLLPHLDGGRTLSVHLLCNARRDPPHGFRAEP